MSFTFKVSIASVKHVFILCPCCWTSKERSAICCCAWAYFNRTFCNGHIPFFWRLPTTQSIVVWSLNIVVPNYMIMDRSLVLLLSFLRVFNLETLTDYLHHGFRVANRCSTSWDINKCLVHACISNVVKSAKYDMKKLL